MATKNYMINDKWLDLDKQNIVELQSVDGVLDSLKVNGSEIETPSGKITITENGTDIDVAQYALADVNVEGGGGSSDFSTAEVTISKGAMGTQVDGIIPWLSEEDNQTYSTVELVDEETLTVKVPVGGNSITVYFSRSAQSTDGNIESAGDVSFMSKNLKSYLITGDCSISFT